MSALKARGATAYLEALLSLLPRGYAWSRVPGSRLGALLHASAEELARIDATARLLIDEINPLTTINGLEDWERVLGLPDACLPAGTSLQERRSAVLAKLRDEGRQDIAYWYEVAESLGYDVTIEEHWPFICGVHECGDPSGLTEREAQEHREIGYLGTENIRYWWNVVVHGERLLLFRCGESLCPERLTDWREATSLECVMQRDKLAHTVLSFDYRSF